MCQTDSKMLRSDWISPILPEYAEVGYSWKSQAVSARDREGDRYNCQFLVLYENPLCVDMIGMCSMPECALLVFSIVYFMCSADAVYWHGIACMLCKRKTYHRTLASPRLRYSMHTTRHGKEAKNPSPIYPSRYADVPV